MKTTKSPTRILQLACEVSRRALRAYSHRFSPKVYTQQQLFACLVLKEAMKLDYRGASAMVEACGDLRRTIGLRKAPHFTTLHKAADRLLTTRRVQRLLDRTVEIARELHLIGPRIALAAIDSSGFESHHASRYYVRRCETGGQFRGKRHSLTYRHFPKLGVLCDCESHLVLSAIVEQGPKPDFGHVDPVVTAAERRTPIGMLLADAGYDAEWIHSFVRLIFGTRTIIPPKHGRPTVRAPTGYWRRHMYFHFNKKRYGQRWQVETVVSMLKRRLGEAVNTRSYWRSVRALLLKVLAHNVLLLGALIVKVFYRAGRDS